jgi:hypothetical protein
MSDSIKSAIIGAVLAAMLSILTGLVIYWLTTNKAELNYSIAKGPDISAATGRKQIYVIEVSNSGSKEVSDVMLQVSIKNGEFSETRTEVSPGIALKENKTPGKVELRADLLNPTDTVKLAFLASLSSGEEPIVTVRAPGVKAISSSKNGSDKPEFFDPLRLLAVIAPTLAAVLGTFLAIARVGLFGRVMGSTRPLNQSEISAYIFECFGIREEANLIRQAGSSASFRGIGDILRGRARGQGVEVVAKYEKCLRALIIFSGATKSSLSVIRHSLDSISSNNLTEEEYSQLLRDRVRESDDPVAWRKKVDAYVQTT